MAHAQGESSISSDLDAQGPTVLPPPVPKVKDIKKRKETTTKLIPLPIYATLPNEGSTYGFMPVFLIVEKESQRTKSIVAPSISWNRIIRFTGTFRLYYYPSDIESLTLIPSVSTNVNRGVTVEYFRMSKEPGSWTREAALHARRSIFYRFFGLGPQTKEGAETSYTRIGGDLGFRQGYNVTRYFNIGANIVLERQLVGEQGVDFLPSTRATFPDVPGMGGATTLYEGLSLRYDTRPNREYSRDGFFTEVTGGVVEGLSGANTFGKFTAESRLLWDELPWLQGGARAFWSYAAGSNIPFYNQSILGGSYRLRGFTEDRFVDKGAWELELEQRISLLTTHIYGVRADWRIDPFVAVGQVYSGVSDFARYARWSGGLGFRAFVHPNVLGRIDTAIAGEGLKIYVELGYPF